jgi:hypothetical protein
MTQPTREQLNKLADKWLKGTLLPQEKEILDQWYDQDSGEPVNWTGRDESDNELAERLLHNIQKKKNTSYPFKRKWQLSAAAVLLISLGIAGYLYLFKLTPENRKTAVASLIKPGKNSAILTLSNGQKISLASAGNGELATETGVGISKTGNGMLTYMAKNTSYNKNSATQYNTIEAPAGGQWQVVLPDGSHVWLNSSSSLTYPTAFTGKERKVQLKGEAYFEVAHNKAMPFKVSSQGQTVEVLGTHFNVMAYANEQAMKTTLLQGSVKVTSRGNTEMLLPGQQAQASIAGLNVTTNADLEDAVAWKNGYFKFNDDLTSTMKKIARWYNIEVVYQTKPDPNLAFGGKISRSRDIAEVLKMIEYTGKVHFKVEGRRVTITK